MKELFKLAVVFYAGMVTMALLTKEHEKITVKE
jgi:hypothetical protein